MNSYVTRLKELTERVSGKKSPEQLRHLASEVRQIAADMDEEAIGKENPEYQDRPKARKRG
jgi:hypothetical protein